MNPLDAPPAATSPQALHAQALQEQTLHVHTLAEHGLPTCVRQLQADLDTPFDAHWLGGRVFDSQLFNAMSFSFPIGEQYFMDSVRAGVAALPPDQQAAWQPTLRSFVGQEAVHRHVHSKFNRVLTQHGMHNAWGPQVQARSQRRLLSARAWQACKNVAATAAYEHLTAVLAQNLLNHPQWLEGAPERLRQMWQWHAVEEVEHRAVAFDLMLALGVPWHWRVLAFAASLWEFNTDFAHQLVLNLRHSQALGRWQTWKQAARLMLGKGGIARTSVLPVLAYLLPGFHPARCVPSAAVAGWLAQQKHSYRVVGERPVTQQG
jgi:uncharacterized protein